MKRILCIFRQLGLGGANKVLAFVANACCEAGYDVEIISLSANRQTLCLHKYIKRQTLGYESEIIDRMTALKRLYNKVRLLVLVRKVVLSKDPDLIITFMSDIIRIVVIATRGLKIPIIGSERSNPYRYSEKEYKKYSKAYVKCSAIVFQTVRAMLPFSKAINNKAFVIHNPCIPRISNIEQFRGERKKIIVSAGRLGPEKQIDMLIKAFERVLIRHPDFKLHIYGEGSERKYLQSLIDKINRGDSIVLKGAFDDVFAEARDCTAFVLTSNSEGMPNVLMEAMSIGMPCISTDCEAGAPRLLLKDGDRGFLVPISDCNALTEAMCRYIEDPNLAAYYGIKAMEINEEFDAAGIEKQWLDVVEKVLACSNRYNR